MAVELFYGFSNHTPATIMPDRPLDTLSDTLQNPELTEAFRKHINSEFSGENLEFHEKVTQLSKDVDDPSITDDQLRASAREIVDQYIRPDSPQQVNVSSFQAQNVVDAVAGIDQASRAQIGEMLEESHREILKLVSKDSFTRFQKTDAYTQASTKVNEVLDAAETKLAQLQARERQLKLNPSMGDKARALVTSGGMVTLIREVERQREAVEQQIRERTQELPILAKGVAKTKVVGDLAAPPPPQIPRVEAPSVDPLELEAGVVGRGRSNGTTGTEAPEMPSRTPSVRESMGGKDAGKLAQGSSVSVSASDKDPSKMSVKDKIKLFDKDGAAQQAAKRGVR